MSNVIGRETMSQVTQVMGEVTGSKEPVVIENVSLVINVYNIGHNGGLCQTSMYEQDFTSSGDIISNCFVKGSNVANLTEEAVLESAPGGLPETAYILESSNQSPLGWIASYNGDLIPFGLNSIAVEIPSFGDKQTWKEIRVCLPPSLLADTETDLHCPSCREKLPKNKSIDFHIKKHLGIVSDNSQNNCTEGKLPCPLFYYCQEVGCQYNVESAEKRFKAYKNVKQHYIKVHAPRLFVCDMCQKNFSTLKIAETHQLMCGEKYNCSTCNSSYNSLEALQTHCRRKNHVYDYLKYKDKRNLVKQEKQKQPSPPQPTITQPTITGGRKVKSSRKLPTLLPKVSGTPSSNDEVFSTIQAFCQQAGVKVDYGCQTVCTAFLKKSNPAEAISGSTGSSFSQKKRKSTDTQTNIVKFRATCLDQRHNATNTNLDWKTVVTSDSQTQTSDISESVDLSCIKGTDTTHFNDEFATIKISETIPEGDQYGTVGADNGLENQENVLQFNFEPISEEHGPGEVVEKKFNVMDEKFSICNSSAPEPTDNGNIGPSLYPEFMSFLEATDSGTQTDPDMFERFGGDFLESHVNEFGNLVNLSCTEGNAYVSVSSTASQTAVESVSSKSLSAEDYEALLNATDEKLAANLQAFSDYIKASGNSNDSTALLQEHDDNDLFFDWENLVEEVYWNF